MPKDFQTRLCEYYLKVGEVLRGEAEVSSIFPNTTDIGIARERIYADFLTQHAPSKCNVFLGGFLFHMDGKESKQLDVLITTDTSPQFNFHNSDGNGKSFSPVEGTLGVASIKSMLDKAQLFDSLDGLSSIPPTESLNKRTSIAMTIRDYEDWPYKIIYASKGLQLETILKHLNEYYLKKPEVPISRRPNIIHVAGQYVIFRAHSGMKQYNPETKSHIETEPGTFFPITTESDLQAIIWVIHDLQQKALASNHILFSYHHLFNSLADVNR